MLLYISFVFQLVLYHHCMAHPHVEGMEKALRYGESSENTGYTDRKEEMLLWVDGWVVG
jgi:hypothetical protein